MNFDPNDPRLTAYALGELDPLEQDELHQLLDESEEARNSVAEIRQTAAWLADELRREPAAASALAEIHHQRIDEALKATSPAPVRRWWRRPYRVLSMAATLLVGATVGFFTLNAYRPQMRAPGIALDAAPLARRELRPELAKAPSEEPQINLILRSTKPDPAQPGQDPASDALRVKSAEALVARVRADSPALPAIDEKASKPAEVARAGKRGSSWRVRNATACNERKSCSAGIRAGSWRVRVLFPRGLRQPVRRPRLPLDNLPAGSGRA